MAALLTAQTTDTTSSGVAINGTPAYIEVPNTSVFNGATLTLQASAANTASGKWFQVCFDWLGD